MSDSDPHAPPLRDPAPVTPPRWQRPRAILGWLGPLGLVLVVAAFVMQRWAEKHGVHCPECDQPTDFAWWQAYFSVRNSLFLAAFSGGLIALTAASGARFRLLGLGAMLAAFVVFVRMPM